MADSDFANAGTWRPLACAGDAPAPRAYHSADACERGIIVFGGDVADLVDDAEARTVFLLDTARHFVPLQQAVLPLLDAMAAMKCVRPNWLLPLTGPQLAAPTYRY